MKHLTIIFLVFALFACKAPQKTMVDIQQKENTNIQNDIALLNEQHLSALTDKLMERLTKDRLKINITQVKYNTDKPIDPGTGKHPVKEENNININRETDVNEKETTHQETDSVSATQLQDKSKINVNKDAKTKVEEEKGSDGMKKIAIGIVIALALVAFIIFKTK